MWAALNRNQKGTAMKLDDMYPSKWLRSSDLQGRAVTVTIASVDMEVLKDDHGRDEHKPAISFQGREKRMILNKTNAQMLASALGDDTDGWIGKPITLFVMKVQGPSGIVDGLRVRVDNPPAIRRTAPQPAPEPERQHQPAPLVPDDLDDDIPF